MKETMMATASSGGSKVMFWIGWVLTILPVAVLGMSASMKFLKPPGPMESFEKLGWHESQALVLGIVELGCAIIYLIPQTAMLGAILLTGYLGGACATHARLNDPGLFTPVVLGVIVWLALFLRDARMRALVPFRVP
jgi:hypothetical protein